jgi:competence CoiA-like predicted nuclease
MLQYAFNKQNELVSINDSVKGLKCELLCPCCNESVIAKQGLKKQWHFAHISGSECAYANETAIHFFLHRMH